MDVSEYIREPFQAAIFAGLVTAGYVHVKHKINTDPRPATSAYVKPAVLVAFLVYFIVSNGAGKRETISAEPF